MTKAWEDSEQDMLRRFGAKPTPASGAGKNSKLDGIINGGWLDNKRVENKYTEKESYRLEKSLFHKSAMGSMLTGSPHILVRVDINGFPVVCMTEKFFLMIKEVLDGIEE